MKRCLAPVVDRTDVGSPFDEKGGRIVVSGAHTTMKRRILCAVTRFEWRTLFYQHHHRGLVRLGLRAGEVADLEFDDFDWTRGEVVIQGKGREDRLPLPSDVGEAVVAYLRRGRPQLTSCRKLIISSRAPLGGITASAVMQVVHRACRRAGLAPSGSHRLRHTAATQMLRQGTSLPEIAQVLRHHHLDTTAIYAKVDRRALRELTQPWPGGAS